jgi:hypothetical protein
MNLKKAIIRTMTRDDLKRVVDALEIGTVDRRNRGSMARSVGKRREIRAEYLLEFLSEIQVKEVCELLGEDSTGRRKPWSRCCWLSRSTPWLLPRADPPGPPESQIGRHFI